MKVWLTIYELGGYFDTKNLKKAWEWSKICEMKTRFVDAARGREVEVVGGREEFYMDKLYFARRRPKVVGGKKR